MAGVVYFVPNPTAMTGTSSPMPTRNFARTPRRRQGFTLLELMVVVFVAAVVTAMSFGKIQALMVQSRIHSASTAMQNDIEAAFALASRNRTPIRISWSSGDQQLRVSDRNGIVYRHLNLGSAYGLTSSNVTFSRNPVEVYPSGLAQDTLLVTLSAYGDTSKVWVSKGGLVKVGR